MARLSIGRPGQALGLFLALLYVLCVAWDGLFPGWAMRSVWAAALPGFDWLSVGDFLLGLVEAYVYGWIAAALFVPVWNAVGRAERRQTTSTRPRPRSPEAHVH